MRRLFLLTLLAGLINNAMLAQSNNVLVIIADDLGVDYMNRYALGNDPAPTPTLDSLADNGILFTNAWTNPICSPSRANILTGKYAFRTGIGTAITGNQSASLDTSEYTIAKAVKTQNVTTAMIGKWHLGHSSQAFRLNPNRSGFDHYEGNIEGQLPSYSIWQKTTNGANTNVFSYATTVAVNDAIDWVDDQSTDWMLVLSFNAPHEPFHRPPNNLHSFDGITTNPTLIEQNPRPHFKAMVEAMDTEIKRLLDHLEASGELAGTDIIFMGDNGSPREVAQEPFDGNKMKGTTYNGGVNIPMIVSGPSVIAPGRSAEELLNSTDLYHTIFELFHGNVATLPVESAPDSRSFMPILTNSSDSGTQRAWIYGDIFRPTPTSQDAKAITDGDYKLIEFDNGTTEFYQISTDYFENTPLDINSLFPIAEEHYNFLCGELSALLDTNFCQLPTGVLDAAIIDIGIYPNPVSETLHIQLDPSNLQPGKVYKGRIFDAAGALIHAFKMSSGSAAMSSHVNVDGLSGGVYQFVLYESGIPMARASFIKQSAGAVK